MGGVHRGEGSPAPGPPPAAGPPCTPSGRPCRAGPDAECPPPLGGAFDPLKLASDDSERTFKLREAEIKHARLAMVAFLGYAVQARPLPAVGDVHGVQACRPGNLAVSGLCIFYFVRRCDILTHTHTLPPWLQAWFTGEGVLGSLTKFSSGF